MKFEKGDRVKCIHSYDTNNHLKFSREYVIESIKYGFLHLVCVDGGWSMNRFEKVVSKKELL